jgi:predicted small secreted protein
MKKLVVALLATVVAFSVAGCAGGMGKGKAPPPVVTKG